jgi:arsenate reductase
MVTLRKMQYNLRRVKMLKVLFVCTHNSARSQIAEALLNEKGKGRIIAYSAGTEPAEEINPLVVEAMREIGIDISEKRPKSIENFLQESFDLVVTLCEKARNQCINIFTNAVQGYWGIDDPHYFEGTYEEKLENIRRIIVELAMRINLLLELPLEKLDDALIKQKIENILRTK